MHRETHFARKTIVLVACVVALAVSASYVAAQYALDFNTRVNTQIGGRGYHNYTFGGRNSYVPHASYGSASPYRVSSRTGAYMYNPNAAFSRSTYRPTTRGYASYPSPYRYSGQIRTR
jgi:hypothetical protein